MDRNYEDLRLIKNYEPFFVATIWRKKHNWKEFSDLPTFETNVQSNTNNKPIWSFSQLFASIIGC